MIKMMIVATLLLIAGVALESGPLSFFFVILSSHYAIRVTERML